MKFAVLNVFKTAVFAVLKDPAFDGAKLWNKEEKNERREVVRSDSQAFGESGRETPRTFASRPATHNPAAVAAR
jgi:hypothetical protein